jgi:primosomal protein N' (replication factor Y)
VRVLPDVVALDKTFDYLVPPDMAGDIRIGTMVRINLHGRRVGGWVVALDPETPADVTLKPIAKVTGWGPPEDLVRLSKWAAWRWAGRPQHFLGTASPPRAVRGLPPTPAPRPPVAAPNVGEFRTGIVRLPPAGDVFPLVMAAAARGDALVVVPSATEAALLAQRVARAGVRVARHPEGWAAAAAGGSTVIGTRAAAWAPMPNLAAVVVVDGHDEGLQEERTPSWNARDVAIERARRADVPWVATSPCPPAEILGWGQLFEPSRADERNGWPILDVIDRRGDDPRSGHFSPQLANLLHREGRVVCVLNRKGRARMLACAQCGELARCTACDGAMEHEPDGDGLRCRSCGLTRPSLCAECGAQKLKLLRVGVTRLAEELSALINEPVEEVTADTATLPATRVVVGTEAVLHRVIGEAVAGVAFLDFDQELMAPRLRANEQALGLLARAARVVGGRHGSGRVLVQTRQPEHEVLQAALHADPARVAEAELERRRALQLPPYAALAAVSGEAAAEYLAPIDREAVVVVETGEGEWLVRAPDTGTLCNTLAKLSRPAGRVRVEVDPLRV